MKIGIFGAGGFGREVLPEIRSLRPNAEIEFVIDGEDYTDKTINGIRVISLNKAIEKKLSMVIAVGDWRTRKRITEIMENNGMKFFEVIARDAVIYDQVSMLDGAVICSKSIITSNVQIGRGFQCNLYSYVAHDCQIGDFVTLAPRVSCNGNIIIEDGAYIGTGAVLKQGSTANPLVIGREAVVGMGAVVTKNVPAFCTVVGNPAKVMSKP